MPDPLEISDDDDDIVGPPIPIYSVNSTSLEEIDDDDDDVGPTIPADLVQPESKKHKPSPSSPRGNRKLPLSYRLPRATLYEKSYMHKDAVTQIHSSIATDFIITISPTGGGIVKFWKKVFNGIEFVKSFSCGSNIVDSVISSSGRELCVLSCDKYLRFFDIESFTMFGMIKLSDRVIENFSTSSNNRLCFVNQPSAPLLLAITVNDKIHVIQIATMLEEPKTYSSASSRFTHTTRVTELKYSVSFDAIISVDDSGFIEVWKVVDGSPLYNLSKFDTDLFELKKKQTTRVLSISVCGEKFALLASNPSGPISPYVYIFNLPECKLIKSIDETLDTLTISQNDPLQSKIHLEPEEFAKRIEREMTKCNSMITFDDSGNFLIYTSLVGIKIVDLTTNSIVDILGKYEHSERFSNISVFQGKPLSRVLETTGDVVGDHGGGEEDPLILATSEGAHSERFFIFSNRMPLEDRDVFNESVGGKNVGRLGIKSSSFSSSVGNRSLQLPVHATIFTTAGDIQIELYPSECPKTVENFSTHSRNGYYDNCVFHRVIKGFMIQTGDAEHGDGTGGKSIWGGEFGDEIDAKKKLNHKNPFMVSMANHGPNTNGSQFFITTVPTPWLDGKHTVFGRVVAGTDTVRAIEDVATGDNDKPVRDIRILQIKVK